MIEGEISSCPSTRIVLDGYSQGAQVTGDVYQSLTFSQRRHIFGVVLFGDPRYNHSSVTDMAKRDNNGILPVRDKFPRDSRGKVLSYCHAQDPVCQGLGQFVLHGSGAHKTYAKTHEPEEAADQLMSKSPSPSSGGLAPVLVTAPQISGTRSLQGIPLALVGNQLSVNDGAWNGNPTSFSYQWYRCDSPADQREFDNCRPIDKALAANYTLATADLGHTIQVKVVAKNASGSTATYGYTHTNYTQTPGLFGNVGAPNPIADDFWADINGTRCTGACTMNPGDVVTAHPGSWDGQGGSAAITFHYQWQSCTTPGEDCSDIPGATNASYSKKASDRWLRVDIYGSNAYGANGLYW
ncbi:MAG TPA: cutinase family protein [Candidatus Saccharimonadales bacterium]|nr:cutinase family protein [Candidatus Saccharimonadales bacterium]